MKREVHRNRTRVLSLFLVLAMLFGFVPLTAQASGYEVVESWENADLSDTEKYKAVNCTLTAGTDEVIGGYVAFKATNYNPTLTVTAAFDATKYTEPTVGFWIKQTRTNTGEVYLLSAGNTVASVTFTPVADEWVFTTVALNASADAIQFVPFVYGNPFIGSIYLGEKADVEAIPELNSAKPYEVVESWENADLTDTAKYAAVNCTLTAGTDEVIGGYVAVKATGYNPTLTVTAAFDATKYTEPTVGFWMKQTRTNTGEVKLLSAGETVASVTFTPVADEWVFTTVALTASADAIQFVPYTHGNPSIGSVYLGEKADVEAIPNEFDFSEPSPEPSADPSPEPSEEPGVPGGQGRWVLVDNYEAGVISGKYSANDNYRIVESDKFGNYSAYNDGTISSYLKYDKPLSASGYENPAIGFWAKGTEGKTLMFWGSSPLGSVTLHAEWTYYVWTGGLKSLISSYGTGELPYIRLWSAKNTEVWLDQIYFGEEEDLKTAPDLAEGYDYYYVIPEDEPVPEYESSDVVVVYDKYDFEEAAIPEGASTSTFQGAVQWEIYDSDRMFTEYYDFLTNTWDSYSLMIKEDTASEHYTEGQLNKGILTLPVFDTAGDENWEINQLAVTFKYMTRYNRDSSVNRWQILPEQNQNLTLEVSATGEKWTEIWNLNEDMGDDLYDGSWYMVSVPVNSKYLSQGKLYYRFVYESRGGNALALDDIMVEEYIAPMENENIDITAYKVHDVGANAAIKGFLKFNTSDPKTVTNYDTPGTYNGQRYSAMDYYNGVIYAVTQYNNTLVALDPYTFEVEEVISNRIGSTQSNMDIYGIAYNPKGDVFYVYQEIQPYSPADYELYEMDPDSGECTLLLHWNTDQYDSLITVFCDKDGNLYGYGGGGRIYAYDFENNAWDFLGRACVGSNGSPWVSSATMNKETGVIYSAEFNGFYKGPFSQLYTIDLNTLRATNLGTVDGCVELVGMVIPYENGIVERVTFTASAGENGKISPSGEVKCRVGKNRVFTCTPDVGYEVDTLTVDGVPVDLASDPNWDSFNNKYTFTNVQEDHTIAVTYKVAEFTVTFVGKNGEVLDTQTVAYGQSAVAPEAPVIPGWTFAGWDTDFSEVYNDLTVKATYTVNTYQVIFLDWNGKILDVQKVRYEKAAEAPEPPVRAGYTFTGWDTDFSCVTTDLVVTAQYTQNGGGTAPVTPVDPGPGTGSSGGGHEHDYTAGEPVYLGKHTVGVTYSCACGTSHTETETIECPSAKFTDLTADWYHEEIDEALYRGLFQGVSDTAFAPDAYMTRGQLVTVLYRLAGSPEVSAETPFSDIVPGSYYADAAAWAYSEGIIEGVTDSEFCPDMTMTREMVAAILWRMQGKPVSGQSLDGFADADSVSEYAAGAMAWAVEIGLIQGVSEDTLAPGAGITRAQGAVLLIRYSHEFAV